MWLQETVLEKKRKTTKKRKPKKAGHLKMLVITDLKAETISTILKANVSKSNIIDSDNLTSYVDLKDIVEAHRPEVIPKEKVNEMLPWVHLAISIAKSLLLNIHHDIKPEYLQGYHNDFCYKYNRKYFGEKLFDRLIIACVSYKNEF